MLRTYKIVMDSAEPHLTSSSKALTQTPRTEAAQIAQEPGRHALGSLGPELGAVMRALSETDDKLVSFQCQN